MAELPRVKATTLIIKPAARGGSSACVTRRVGGDQKGSDSLRACRRTRRNEPATAITPTPAQKRMNARGEPMLIPQPSAAAARPTTPLKIMMGASARR